MSIISPPTWTGMIPTTGSAGSKRRLSGAELVDLSPRVGEVHVQRHGIAIDQQGDGV